MDREVSAVREPACGGIFVEPRALTLSETALEFVAAELSMKAR